MSVTIMIDGRVKRNRLALYFRVRMIFKSAIRNKMLCTNVNSLSIKKPNSPFQGRNDFFLSPSMPAVDRLLLCLLPQLRPER